MKKIFRTVAALAVVMFAGCTNDLTNDVVAPVGEGTTVTLGLDTKTSLGELVDGSRKVYWSAGDQININGNTSKEAVIDADNAGLATFSFGKILNTPYSILYPAEDYKDASTITLPAVQAAASGSFGVDAAPMAAYVTAVDETPLLLHLTAVIRLQIKAAENDARRISKIEFRGDGSEQVSGDFAINYQTATLTPASSSLADKVVALDTNRAISADKTVDFFIVVPAQEYAGFTVRVVDENGHYMEKSSAATIELAKGQIVAMPPFTFEPTGTDVNVEINSAAELVAFAKAYNAGEYEDVDPLVVHVKSDIVFDDATNAEWEPIGVLDNYFDGSFQGNNHVIKSWTSSKPLFAFTGTHGGIFNLTLDSSCTFNVVAAEALYHEVSTLFGAFVSYHKGELNNCHNNADVVVTGEGWVDETAVGGLVGRISNGSIVDCTMGGDFTVDGGFKTTYEVSNFGGIVGWSSHPDGVISGSKVLGNITHMGGSSYVNPADPHVTDGSVFIGGIVGKLIGQCSDCHLDNATANTKRVFVGNYIHSSFAEDGVTVNYNGNDYRSLYIGGIAGRVDEDAKVANCTNDSEMVYSQYNGAEDGENANIKNDVSRFLNAGGIAGQVFGTVSDCTMYGDILNRSSCLQHKIGGIVGVLGKDGKSLGSLKNCANEGANIKTNTAGIGNYSARNGYFGGVVGLSYTTNVSELSNRAYVEMSRPNTNTNATVVMGGIFGAISSEGTIDGQNKIVNYGKIASTHGVAIKYTTVGGIAGQSAANLKNVTNEGEVYHSCSSSSMVYANVFAGGIVGYATGNNVILTSVTNNGNVYLAGASGNTQKHYNWCAGGILGTNDDAISVSIQSAVNVGIVAITGNTSKCTGRSTAVGGIVGALTNGASSISSCTNTGCISNANFNNYYDKFTIREANGNPHAGGIAGIVYGTEDDRIAVTNCTNNRTVGTDSSLLYHKESAISGNRAVAGFIGTVQYVDITECNCSTYVSNANSSPIAGFVVLMDNSKLDGCTLSGSTMKAGNAGVPYTVGLVACVSNSTISNNIVDNVTLISGTAGVLAGLSDAASTFTNNKVSGNIDGTAITLSSVMVVSGSPTITGTKLHE
ncbi:MAG: hypothetical protein E7147_06125 [Rikenellaceae bacterium]|nr:hypothetical protein [Rikenellaceae bacterium]